MNSNRSSSSHNPHTMTPFSIKIAQDGTISFIYYDQLVPLLHAGTAAIRRVSHVEPTRTGQWTADLTPVGGPILGPFVLREQALQAETTWLSQHYLRSPIVPTPSSISKALQSYSPEHN